MADRRSKRDLHALDEDGMLICNPRDREAAHRAEHEGIATEDMSAVTCRKCLDRLTPEQRRQSPPQCEGGRPLALELSQDARDCELSPQDPQSLLEALLAHSIETIELRIFDLVTVEVPVEDDAIALLEAAIEAQTLESGMTLEVFLNDGAVDISAALEGGIVRVELLHTPYLDKRLGQSYEQRVPFGAFARAWRQLHSELCAAAACP